MNHLRYVRENRNMSFLRRGLPCFFQGNPATVIGASRMGYLRIRLDGEKRVRFVHPQWEMIYYSEDGSILAEYTEKPCSFSEE